MTDTQKATFAAGCFWQVEADYRKVDGVIRTEVGYMGGAVDTPTYEDVCTDRTGHAEVTQVEFDPERISYEQLVEMFWGIHDPTQVNRQGPDVGTQYRSALFTHDEDQALIAKRSLAKAQARFPKPIATEIVPAETFWTAEEYHQRYLEKRGMASCTLELAETDAAD
jgi:peptide-methionine (S)-S-oxide reductase